MKTSLLLSIFLFGCTFIASAQNKINKKERRPNLLFIITDQQRYDALSIAGNKVLKTPNLDRLAKQGTYFKKAYTPMAVCAPARAAIMTGRTVENTRVVNNYVADTATKASGAMPQRTFDEILAANGYWVEYYGKYHSPSFHNEVYRNPEKMTSTGEPIMGQGMRQHYVDYLAKHVPMQPLQEGEYRDHYSGRGYTPNPLDKRFNSNAKSDAKFTQPDFHGRLNIPADHSITAMHAKETMAALERLKDKMFSITCSFHFPHAPMLPTSPYYQMYHPDRVSLPKSLQDEMTNSPYKAANGRNDNPEYADPEKIKYMISDYYGLVKEVDDWMGKILAKLDELGLAVNTLVIFTSDHGEMLGAHGLREKNVFYEESSRVPLMIRLPGAITRKTVVDHYVTNIDLFPTIFDYLGLEKQPSDGKSLRDLMEKRPARPAYIVTEWNFRGASEPNYMIVKGGWKMFIPQTPSSKVIDVLYNLNEDPYEMHNLIGNNPDGAKYAAKVSELKADLIQWLKDHDSKFVGSVSERNIVKN